MNVKEAYLYGYSSLGAQVWHLSALENAVVFKGALRMSRFTLLTCLLTRDQTDFPCHPHVYPQVEWTRAAFNPQPQSVAALYLWSPSPYV